MSNTPTNVFCWNPRPGLEWRAYEKSTGIISVAETRELAIAEFEKIWNSRAPIEWVHTAPPRPKRPDERPQQDKAIEHDAISYASLAKRFHPDLLGSKRRFSAHEIMQIVNELREAK
jgi:hypothetical protein